VILDVYGIGCGPCNQLAPVLDGVANQYRGQATVYRINAANLEQNPALAQQLGVRSVPAVFIFDQGRLVSNDVGFHEAGFYTSKLDGLVGQRRQNETRDVPRPSPPNPDRLEEERESSNLDEGRPRNLGARLERIKDNLARLTHLSTREKEQAFNPSSDEQRTLELINKERRRHRLPDVIQDPRLQIIASRHTDYQISHGMTHNENTPGWQNVAQRMKQVGLQGWRENAATGSFTPETLVQMWMNSKGHRDAILGQGNIAAVSIRRGKATFNLTTDPELGRERT
jgi:thiol-disulfide isomerase/thioredoxin